MATFEQLADKRRLLQNVCSLNYLSLEGFHSGLSFTIYDDEQISPRRVRHLTSTATCYGSLIACPSRFRPANLPGLEEPASRFADKAIALQQNRWKSDGSAHIYCRCRALPFVIRRVTGWHEHIGTHVRLIFQQMVSDEDRFAIGEADPGENKDKWYPPNAYHTYWALRVLDEFKQRFPVQYERLNSTLHLGHKSVSMREWALETLAYQVSLHCADSSVLDSDQRVWALAIVCESVDAFQASLKQQDFIRQAFNCLFSTQTKIGNWRNYATLFHYRKTGNAYCYVFESFGVLLQAALHPKAEFVRNVLHSHFDKLLSLWQYACSTQVQIDESRKQVAWSSGHRTNKSAPESWATASVFSYAQALRRLVGIWTRGAALSALPKRVIYASKDKSKADLAQRTKNWTSDNGLGDQVWSMFVNPPKDGEPLEPDDHPIGEQFARSAILYGPPGASKTTIVRALAGVIGWEYVELHASHFVADGLPNVQRKADEIFTRLMELDRVIVLFDEIDELVREREKSTEGESDIFGRFLTTSMLPKLAELWDSRKIMYFVASNHIRLFDRAIARSQRFDAVIFVSPPSFQAKINQLKKLLRVTKGKTFEFAFSKEDVDAAVKRCAPNAGIESNAGSSGSPRDMLAKFALLRWGELAELAIPLYEA